jgi:TRAP transporter TAXI family solute receptor
VPAPALTVDAIARNLVDWGVERADLAYSGHAAQQLTTPLEQQVRGIALLQPLPIHLLARPRSGIHTLADLRGATIATGPINTSSHVLARLIVESAHIPNVTLKPINSRATASQGLLAGTLDAAFFPGYVYPDDEVYAAVKQGAYLLPIDGPVVDAVRQKNPFVRVITIPRNIYPGEDRLTPTIGIEMVVICRQGLSDEIVHDATKELFEVYPRLASVEASLRFLNLDNAPATPIPLHPGAARYYRELQLSQ